MCCIGKLSYQQNPSVYVYYFQVWNNKAAEAFEDEGIHHAPTNNSVYDK